MGLVGTAIEAVARPPTAHMQLSVAIEALRRFVPQHLPDETLIEATYSMICSGAWHYMVT